MAGIEIATGELMHKFLPWKLKGAKIILISGGCSNIQNISKDLKIFHDARKKFQLTTLSNDDLVPVLLDECSFLKMKDEYRDLSLMKDILKNPSKIQDKDTKPHFKFTPTPWSFKRK